MANIKDFIKKIGNSAVSIEEQQQALAQVEQTIIEAKQKRTEAIGKNADMVIQALKTIEAKLEAKLTELNNTPAKQGVQGPVGKDGKDGKDGKNGRDGLNGKDGTDGKDGVDGKDGISVVDAKIDFDGSLVIYLSNGNEIDCGQILSPDVAQNIIINSGGSGTSQTVTDTLVSLQNQINTLTGMDGVLGDMAQQNANAVAITGGTINGTTIGATTPSTGNFTTLQATGVTTVQAGTASLPAITTSGDTNTGIFFPAADTIAFTKGGAEAMRIDSSGNVGIATTSPSSFGKFAVQGAASNRAFYTTSLAQPVARYDDNSFVSAGFTLRNTDITASNQGIGILFQLGASGTPVSSGSIEMRSEANFSSGANQNAAMLFFTVFNGTNTERMRINSSGNVSIIGTTSLGTASAQYIQAVGNATEPQILAAGSGTNIPLVLQPKGTGAIQAQATTSTSAGGNARGANAVDWQTVRNTAAQVASSASGTIAGGEKNAVSGTYAAISGGFNNTASDSASYVGGGSTNTASGFRAAISGGWLNTAAGYMNFVGGGFTNSGTSGSAVTTQSGTMNGTTAVTLSGSNANIKVGQYITGTSIATGTYVAAISGTSLTLSQNASGSSTSTLSFFTPHGVVVGGGNNQATGAYSFIGGGGDAGTAGNRNTASGDWSTVGGGVKNVASGIGSVVCGGGYDGTIYGNTASGVASTVLGGASNTASNQFANVLGGVFNTASGAFSTTLGASATTRGINGNIAFSAQFGSVTFNSGTSQSALLILGRQTTDATATALTSNSSAAGTTNQVILPNNSAYYFRGEIVAGVTGGGNTKGWFVEGVIKRGANAASTAIVGTATVTSNYADAGASTWAVTATADTTNGGLKIEVTGQASTTIRWVAQIRTTEMTY